MLQIVLFPRIQTNVGQKGDPQGLSKKEKHWETEVREIPRQESGSTTRERGKAEPNKQERRQMCRRDWWADSEKEMGPERRDSKKIIFGPKLCQITYFCSYPSNVPPKNGRLYLLWYSINFYHNLMGGNLFTMSIKSPRCTLKKKSTCINTLEISNFTYCYFSPPNLKNDSTLLRTNSFYIKNL